MNRIAYKEIELWADHPRRKPLVLMGARQVGKTWLMDAFAQEHFPGHVVKVNFMRSAALSRAIAQSNLDPAGIIRMIQTETGKEIQPGKTLLILDEIQECPCALTSLKFFKEDLPGLHVMAAGSLLGLSFGEEEGKSKPSFPVGMIDRLDVSPMTFAEFLDASGKSGLVKAVREGEWDTVSVLSAEYVDLLKSYLVVGGMPEAVKVWTQTHSFAKARAVQKSILADYDDDFKKHAPEELLPKIRLLWDNIPSQLAKENKKFVYTALKSGARAREYETALQWLEDAGMIHQVYRTCPPRLPLKAYRDLGAFKLYVHDVGLLGAISELTPRIVLEGNALFSNFKGAITEQFVAQEISALGVPMGYWTPDVGTAEVDFVVQGETAVYPIEVKSATNAKAKSLSVYRRSCKPPFAFKSSLRDYSGVGDVRSLPLYALGMRLICEIAPQNGGVQ